MSLEDKCENDGGVWMPLKEGWPSECYTGTPEQECKMKIDHFWDVWAVKCVSMEADCQKNDGLWVPSDTGG